MPAEKLRCRIHEGDSLVAAGFNLADARTTRLQPVLVAGSRLDVHVSLRHVLGDDRHSRPDRGDPPWEGVAVNAVVTH